MAKKTNAAQERVDYHADASVRARGQMLDGELHGYWQWFRADGTLLRSGHFERGVKVGEWTTCDQAGKVYKVTKVKSKQPAR